MNTLNYIDNIGHAKGLFFCFILGFGFRLIPEVLSFPHPIGFDTVYYASRIESGVVWYYWSNIFSSWFLYALLVPVYSTVSIDLFLLLKLVAPMLYALNVCGVYYFARQALGWDVQKSLATGFVFAFQLAILRISWDLHMNMLGFALLLVTLPLLKKLETRRSLASFVLLSVLVVFSHELASVLMFAAVLWVIAKDFLKGDTGRMIKIFGATIPALATFLARWFVPLLMPINYVVNNNIIGAFQPVSHPGGLFFLANYLNLSGTIQYASYLDLFLHVVSLFVVLYLLSMPLVLIGFFRDKILDGCTSILLIAAFSSLVSPFFALNFWDRWMFLLVYPFTFYAVNGIWMVLKSKDGVVFPRLKLMEWMRVSKRLVYAIVCLSILFGVLLVTVRIGDNGVFSIPTTGVYLPSTMLQNTVPDRDVEGVVEVMNWLNERMEEGSVILLHQAFLWWGRLYLDDKIVIIHYLVDVQEGLDVALEQGFNPVYLVWWEENPGWYQVDVPNDYMQVFESGRIAAFQYVG